ncbi:pH-response regulator protein palF/rim-8 [Pyricularia oryzae Y34]|uniref:PalF n=3 Tax=Pyricularia oryzae TaxID=318829 RepID=G0Z5J1_PYROR|nr:PalF [Pyricularia oryzae]ELQ43250.1 pH-response regulator protein palF/rim-8 [Pyricularia oryzae Y34]
MGGSSASRNQSSLLEDTHTSRSLISRLFSRSKTRHITDFHIRPVDPHRKYAKGDHVTGAVVLTVLRPIRITHLTVALHGFVKVFKSPNAAHEATINTAQIASGVTNRTRYLGNGLASLFQDEQVLSADGKLEAGRYEFNFDLVFPSKVNLPTSIDENLLGGESRHRIHPSTAAANDISRANIQEDTEEEDGPTKAPESVAAESNIANDAAFEGQQAPQSPTRTEMPDVMSEVSTESAITSSSAGASVGYKVSEATGSSSGSQFGARTPTVEEKTITASVEMLKGGCLPGDFVPVKISVHHIKRIKSVHGVIVTLYRQGRIDSAPPISSFQGLSKEDVRRLEKEEYFPRSKTGLSGLSLSSAGSCSVFRKDLSQAFGPLIIDPITLDASVTISVRVPEDVFPTIKGVPGELISFKYQMEVIVDLGGKLASQISSVQSKAGGISAGGAMPSARNPYESGGSSIMGSWGNSIIDTDQLRRHKGVISVVFEVPVGSVDSSRQRTRGGSLRPNPQARQPSQATESSQIPTVGYGPEDKQRAQSEPAGQEDYVHSHGSQGNGPMGPSTEYVPSPYYTPHDPRQQHAPIYIPPPDVPNDMGLSEKERARRAEQRLLPSQPPAAPFASTLSETTLEDIYNVEDDAAAGPSSAPIVGNSNGVATAPTLDEVESGEAAVGNSEDKLERERHRLLQEASAPPDFPEDYDTGDPGPSNQGPVTSATAPALSFQPSAPILSEDDEDPGSSYFNQHTSTGDYMGAGALGRPITAPHEPLPRYQR